MNASVKPAYEKAATSLKGLAKVAAVNCDAEENKPFCGSMGVQGFPTLKIVKPGKKPGKPFVEDYQGARSAKAIVDYVVDKIPNHVKRLKDADYESWLEEGEGPKAILFSEKGTTSALLKAIAVDFLGGLPVAQIRDKETAAVSRFHVENYPTLVLVPGEGKDPIKYDGEMKKDKMVRFLSQAVDPNPDPAPKKAKASSSSKASKPKSKSSSSSKASASASFSKASASHASAEGQTAPASQTAESLDDASQPTHSPDPNVVDDQSSHPIDLPSAPPIPSLPDTLTLQQSCLNTKSATCILALLPPPADTPSEPAALALRALSEIRHKHIAARRALFPFYQLPAGNPQAAALRASLGLEAGGVELLAVNAKRAWWRRYATPSASEAAAFTQRDVEAWVDGIRMGDSAAPKREVPRGLIVEAEEVVVPPREEEPAGRVKVEGDEGGEGGEEEMLRRMREGLPEGMELEMEEIGEEEYEGILRRQREMAGKREGEGEGVVHDEL